MAASKKVQARVDRATQAAKGGKPPIWCQGPAWTPPGRPHSPGPDVAPRHDVNAWGVDVWTGQRKGYRVELVALVPLGHRVPTEAEGLAEVARRLEEGPPPAPPRPAPVPVEPRATTTPAPRAERSESAEQYLDRCLREPGSRPLPADTLVSHFDPYGLDTITP